MGAIETNVEHVEHWGSGSDQLSSNVSKNIENFNGKISRFLVKNHGKDIKIIPQEKVIAIQADEKYLYLYTQDGKKFLIEGTIKEFLPLLEGFSQVHRNLIVRETSISGVTKNEKGEKVIQIEGNPKSDKGFLISRRNIAEVNRILKKGTIKSLAKS